MSTSKLCVRCDFDCVYYKVWYTCKKYTNDKGINSDMPVLQQAFWQRQHRTSGGNVLLSV